MKSMGRLEPDHRMQQGQRFLPGLGDRPLACHFWRPSGPPRAVLVCVHGIGGHGGTFEGLAQALVPHGYALEALDLPGHGRSPGRRGWLRRWQDWRQAVLLVLNDVLGPVPVTPCFLVGHSMGGAVVLDLALEEPEALRRLLVQGLILSNPALDAGGIARWRLLLARLFARFWPGFTLRTGIAETAASRDPQVLARRAADPLRHSLCSARLGSEFLAATARLRQTAPRLRLPLLLLQSGADSVTPGVGARHVFAAAGSADKTWRHYPESYHELYDDLDREQVFADLLAWLADHDGPASPGANPGP